MWAKFGCHLVHWSHCLSDRDRCFLGLQGFCTMYKKDFRSSSVPMSFLSSRIRLSMWAEFCTKFYYNTWTIEKNEWKKWFMKCSKKIHILTFYHFSISFGTEWSVFNTSLWQPFAHLSFLVRKCTTAPKVIICKSHALLSLLKVG